MFGSSDLQDSMKTSSRETSWMKRHGAPITLGFGRYAPNQSMSETIAVDDVMVVLQGRLTITSGDLEMKAEAG
jgi:ethanolamine utilization protein EutQ (cupin superfamily)